MKNTKNTRVPPIGRFIDPLTDFGFKRIFGSASNKDLLIAFLNELFKGQKIIKDLTYNPQESSGPAKHFRKTIFDLTCTGVNGETFIVEVQRAEQKFFIDRAVFYTASRLYEQGLKGEKNWNFELKEIYFVGLMDFRFDNIKRNKYLHRVRLTEEETGEIVYNKLGFIFIELSNFNLQEKGLKTDLHRWLYLLRNMSEFNKVSVISQKRVFQKLFQVAEVSNLEKEEYMLYEKSLMDKWDAYSVLKTAEDRGIEKGVEKGAEQKSHEVVRNLLASRKFSISEIAGFANVTEVFVKKIKALQEKKK